MKIETISVSGISGAILGMRLPMCLNLEEVKNKSDSVLNPCDISQISVGRLDSQLCKNLIKADNCGCGQPNSKFLRMIHVQAVVTAPLFWWKEADTYKVGTTTNSTSTMHKLASTPITRECFEMDDFEDFDIEVNGMVYSNRDSWNTLIAECEFLRQKYNETKDKKYWKALIRKLPESWLQTRMYDLDYSTLRNIYKWRKNHKLSEWHKFCDWIKTLPLAEILICEG